MEESLQRITSEGVFNKLQFLGFIRNTVAFRCPTFLPHIPKKHKSVFSSAFPEQVVLSFSISPETDDLIIIKQRFAFSEPSPLEASTWLATRFRKTESITIQDNL